MAGGNHSQTERTSSDTAKASSDEEGILTTSEESRCQLWADLYKKSKYCDVLLVVDKEEREAHKAMLACASEFFDKMFTGGLKEAQCSDW